MIAAVWEIAVGEMAYADNMGAESAFILC